MAPSSFKPKLLLDEGFPRRHKLPNLNQRFDIKHITGDFDKTGWSDEQVYQFATQENRLVVTYNEKDFRELATLNKASGVIGVSDNLSTEHIDKKLAALLAKRKANELYGKFTPLTGETEIR